MLFFDLNKIILHLNFCRIRFFFKAFISAKTSSKNYELAKKHKFKFRKYFRKVMEVDLVKKNSRKLFYLQKSLRKTDFVYSRTHHDRGA